MIDEPMQRLLAYDRRQYWLVNGWSIRFRVVLAPQSEARPHGMKYSLTLHDVDGMRLLGFDNAHGVGRTQAYDHRHRFKRTQDLVPYEFESADQLICDFFAAVERACEMEGVAFEFDAEAVELIDEPEDEDDPQIAE